MLCNKNLIIRLRFILLLLTEWVLRTTEDTEFLSRAGLQHLTANFQQEKMSLGMMADLSHMAIRDLGLQTIWEQT